MIQSNQTKKQPEKELHSTVEPEAKLIVINDEVNHFKYVIETLIMVCNHTSEQAEQCAMIIHNKGRYTVKRGSFDDMCGLSYKLLSRGLDADVE